MTTEIIVKALNKRGIKALEINTKETKYVERKLKEIPKIFWNKKMRRLNKLKHEYGEDFYKISGFKFNSPDLVASCVQEMHDSMLERGATEFDFEVIQK